MYQTIIYLAISAASANMTSLSNKRIEEIAEKYKSENTKELILKGYTIYWLATDTCNVKVKADTLDAPEPTENEIPRPAEVPRQEEQEVESKKRSSYFKKMYMSNGHEAIPQNTTQQLVAPLDIKEKKGRKRRGAPTPEERLTPEDKDIKSDYDTQNAKVAYAMKLPTEPNQNVKIMVMDHVEG